MDRLILKEYFFFVPDYSVEFYFFISILQLSYKTFVIRKFRKSDILQQTVPHASHYSISKIVCWNSLPFHVFLKNGAVQESSQLTEWYEIHYGTDIWVLGRWGNVWNDTEHFYCCSENDRKWCVALQKPAWKSLHSIVMVNSHLSCRKPKATSVWNLYGIVLMRIEIADYTECDLILKVKASLSSVFILHLHCVFFFWLSVGKNCGKFSNF